MEKELIELITSLRAVVGYLGELNQYDWWHTEFFTPVSSSFLAPIFPRTQMLARSNGVTAAAALLHDQRIGVGRVFHLFRLPEEMEQSIVHMLHDAFFIAKIEKSVVDKPLALAFLHSMTNRLTAPEAVGPVHIGDAAGLYVSSSWPLVAAHYSTAFGMGTQRFPYFTGRSA